MKHEAAKYCWIQYHKRYWILCRFIPYLVLLAKIKTMVSWWVFVSRQQRTKSFTWAYSRTYSQFWTMNWNCLSIVCIFCTGNKITDLIQTFQGEVNRESKIPTSQWQRMEYYEWDMIFMHLNREYDSLLTSTSHSTKKTLGGSWDLAVEILTCTCEFPELLFQQTWLMQPCQL